MNSRGTEPPTTLLLNCRPEPRERGLISMATRAVLAVAAGLLLVGVVGGRGLADRLAVGDAGQGKLDLEVELLEQAPDGNIKVGIAEAFEDRLAGAGVAAEAEAGVFLDEALKAGTKLVDGGLGAGAHRHAVDGLGEGHGGRSTGLALVARVSPVRVSLSLATTPMSPGERESTGSWSFPRWR